MNQTLVNSHGLTPLREPTVAYRLPASAATPATALAVAIEKNSRKVFLMSAIPS